MKHKHRLIRAMAIALIPGSLRTASDLPLDRLRRVRTVTIICGALIGLGSGISTGFGLLPHGTPLSDSIFVFIPVTIIGIIAAALASRWIGKVALAARPSMRLSPFLGAWLGFVGGAAAGGITFAVAFTAAIPTVTIPDGYWGPFNYPQAVGMGFLAGAFWIGLAGVPIGAIVVPIIVAYVRPKPPDSLAQVA